MVESRSLKVEKISAVSFSSGNEVGLLETCRDPRGGGQLQNQWQLQPTSAAPPINLFMSDWKCKKKPLKEHSNVHDALKQRLHSCAVGHLKTVTSENTRLGRLFDAVWTKLTGLHPMIFACSSISLNLLMNPAGTSRTSTHTSVCVALTLM